MAPIARKPKKQRRKNHESDASESDGFSSTTDAEDDLLLDAAIAENKKAAIAEMRLSLRAKLEGQSTAGATSSESSRADDSAAHHTELEGLAEDLVEEAAIVAEEAAIAAEEVYLEELETRAAAMRATEAAHEWIASARAAADAAIAKAEAAEPDEAEEASLAVEEATMAAEEATEAAEASIAGAEARLAAAEARTVEARLAAEAAEAAAEQAAFLHNSATADEGPEPVLITSGGEKADLAGQPAAKRESSSIGLGVLGAVGLGFGLIVTGLVAYQQGHGGWVAEPG